jgi:glycosyltransferase involved in cell wall biosynthesis
MISGRDIVCVSFVAWDDHWGTPQQWMSRLARENRVFFVDQPVSPLSLVTGIRRRDAVLRQFKRWRRGPQEVAPNVWQAAPPPVLPFRFNAFVNRLNARILRRWLARETQRLGFRDAVYWNFQPSLPGLASAVAPALSVYHCVDDFASVPHWWNPASNVREREAECCREADVVICTGRKLVESRRQYNPEIHFVPEGADVRLFLSAQAPETAVPEDIADLRPPVIGYVGVLDFRLDTALLAFLAERHPDWSLALVGPQKSDTEDLTRLREMPNVRFLGNRPIAQLPAYIKKMDVCTIPYVLNDYTHHIFPLKLYEYMAAGKPIVATDMEEMRPYEGAEMAIGRTREDFLAAVERALAEDSMERIAARQRAALGESWDDRVEQGSAILARLLEARAARAGAPEEALVP